MLKKAGANLSGVKTRGPKKPPRGFLQFPPSRMIRYFRTNLCPRQKKRTRVTNCMFNALANYDEWKKDDAANDRTRKTQ